MNRLSCLSSSLSGGGRMESERSPSSVEFHHQPVAGFCGKIM
jgi:hypothetical protein